MTLVLLPLSHAMADESDGGEEAAHAHEHEHAEHGSAETIVVTASPLVHDRDELAVPVDRIDRSELLQNLIVAKSVKHSAARVAIDQLR